MVVEAQRVCGGSSKGRRLRALLALTVVGAAVVASLGLTGSASSRTNATAEAPKEPDVFCQVQRLRVNGAGPTDPEEEWCGSPWNDDMTSRVGLVIEAHKGKDVIRAQNYADDEIYGGLGRDTAYLDRGDQINSIEKCIPGPCSRYKKAVRSTNRAFRPSDFRYPSYGAIVECRTGLVPAIWLPAEPSLRAVDATPGTDWQTVAVQFGLVRLDGTEWKVVDTKEWLWDRVTDKTDFLTISYRASWKSFTGNKGRRYVSFTPPGPGTYRVVYLKRWYKTPAVPEYESLAMEGIAHYSPDGRDAPTHDRCVYP